MRVEKGITEGFENYSVLVITELSKPWYMPKAWWANKKIETELKFVLEADDDSGKVTRQLCDVEGNPIFTNGTEDIVYSNTVKLLLLMPPLKLEFLKAGYHPKGITTYEKGLKIVNRNPTVSIAMSIKDKVDENELDSVRI